MPGPKLEAEPRKLIPAKALARQAGIPYTSLRDLVTSGQLPVVKIGARWYFTADDWNIFVQQQRERIGG
jgi:hypothetical protein